MDAPDSSPAVLVQHDGELADVCQLLDEIGARYVERLGDCPRRQPTSPWDLIVASPRRILQFDAPPAGPKPTFICVMQGDSRTLRSHLRRMRVDVIACRPVHPAALRLLFLHALYRGPERRRRERVAIGAEVRIRRGLRTRTATLTDLSLRGCRLLGRSPVPRDARISVIASNLAPIKRTLKLKGTVVRSGSAPDSAPGLHVIAVHFGDLAPRVAADLQAVLDAHRGSPAVARESVPSDPAQARERMALPEPEDEEVAAAADVAAEHAAATPHDDGGTPGEHDEGGETPRAVEGSDDTRDDHSASEAASPCGDEDDERRGAARRSYDKRIVALGEAATRVLLGRDISTGGMRVDPGSSLELDETVKLALHAGARSEPVVVRARVVRDDGDAGLVLQFELEAERQVEQLEKLLAHLPMLDGSAENEQGVMLGEIVDRENA